MKLTGFEAAPHRPRGCARTALRSRGIQCRVLRGARLGRGGAVAGILHRGRDLPHHRTRKRRRRPAGRAGLCGREGHAAGPRRLDCADPDVCAALQPAPDRQCARAGARGRRRIQRAVRFMLLQTLVDGPTTLHLAGRYFDRFVREEGRLLLRERQAVYDTTMIATDLVYPV